MAISSFSASHTHSAYEAEYDATTHSGPCGKEQVQTVDSCRSVYSETLLEFLTTLIPPTELACHFVRSFSKSKSLIVLLQGESNSYYVLALGKSRQAQYRNTETKHTKCSRFSIVFRRKEWSFTEEGGELKNIPMIWCCSTRWFNIKGNTIIIFGIRISKFRLRCWKNKNRNQNQKGKKKKAFKTC